MEFKVDEHLQLVLEFMQSNFPASKLIGIAEKLPEMARLLWGHFEQEPVCSLLLSVPKTLEHPSRLFSSESSPEKKCVGDGSVVEADVR